VLDRKVVRDFLYEELGEVEVPNVIFKEALVGAFCKKVLKYLKGLDGCSLRQVSRLTGFTVNKIFKV